MGLLDREAALTWGGIATAVGAVIVLLRSFDVGISASQEEALLKFCTIALPIIVALVIRGFVWSKANVTTKVDEAHTMGKEGTLEPPKVF